MRIVAAVILTAILLHAHAQIGVSANTTPTWEETIAFYQSLADEHSGADLLEIGHDDCGIPIHLFVLSNGSGTDPESSRKDGKNILLINNAIHPGEPCGVNASMRLAKGLLDDAGLQGLIDKTTVCIIPMYNISGAERRGCCSRANQVGPDEYGFRGNARNLDLNRDMIKMDSRNAQALIKVIRDWDPDVFIDTHTTDGSDHQYTMQLLATQDDRLNPSIQAFMSETFNPQLYAWMDSAQVKMCPYFWPKKDVPNNGLIGFDDSPRYSSGYTTLFNIFGFVTEAHMLKSFPERVDATYQLELAILDVMARRGKEMRSARLRASDIDDRSTGFRFNHKLDKLDSLMIPFDSYKFNYYTSAVTGVETYRYFPEDPITIETPYFDTYVPQVEVSKPAAYVIPQEWREVIQRLRWNQVPMQTIQHDTAISVQAYRIVDMTTSEQPYEGHYVHSDIRVEKESLDLELRAGDMMVPVSGRTARFVVEVLEPQSSDSYFAWGFFDSVLQQKEWFSPYIFEDKAKQMLLDDKDLKKEFEAWRVKDPERIKNGWAQLYWLYQRSSHYERTANLYPVYRLE